MDGHSRLAYVEVKGTSGGERRRLSALRPAPLPAAGHSSERVMTDNARTEGSGRFQRVLRWLGLKHKPTRPYTPRTNGKAERFIPALLNEWA